MSRARNRAAEPAPAVTPLEPEASAAALASTASADQASSAPAPTPVQEQAAPAGTDPVTDSVAVATSAEPTEAETPTSATTEGEPAASAQDAATDAPAPAGEPVILGVDYSSTADQTAYVVDGGDAGRSFMDATMAVQAASSRAPYTRGGIHFASRRTPVVLPPTTTPDQVRRLVSDVAVTLSLLHVASGKSVELPRDLFGPTGEPDFDRLTALSDDLARQVAEAGGKA